MAVGVDKSAVVTQATYLGQGYAVVIQYLHHVVIFAEDFRRRYTMHLENAHNRAISTKCSNPIISYIHHVQFPGYSNFVNVKSLKIGKLY